jgi:hypothetical protein
MREQPTGQIIVATIAGPQSGAAQVAGVGPRDNKK